MRRVEHPGPVAAKRRLSADCALRHQRVKLEPGGSLLETVATLLTREGAVSAVASLRGGSFEPFVFVMPALSKSSAHAVYFSDRHEPQGRVRLETGMMTIGRRDGQPWLHCHGTWMDEQGERMGGHVLPNDAVIATAVEADIWLLLGAAFEVVPNPETSFSLFEPVALDFPAKPSSAFALIVRANEDLSTALEQECQSRGITRAVVRGGVGSLVGASFEDGRSVEPFVTEVFIQEAHLGLDSNGQLQSQIDVSLVDYLGGLSSGRLQRGENPVLVTFELVIEPI